MATGRSERPEPLPGGRGLRPPDRKSTATGEVPPWLLELTCLVCGHMARVRNRGEWSCSNGATHTRVRVQAVPEGS